MRAARWVPALLAAAELRRLLEWIGGSSSGSGGMTGAVGGLAPWIVAIFALGAVAMLRESARGLTAELPKVSWSRAVGREWLRCSLGILCVLACAHALVTVRGADHVLRDGLSFAAGAGTWTAVLAAIGAGLVLAASLQAARWVSDVVARRRSRSGSPGARRPASTRRPTAESCARVPTPLLAGWSDRGPPRGLAVTAA